MNTNEEKFYNNCFTEIDDGKVNAEFNKATLKCFDSKDNKFSMDCEGNLVVNSIITRETNNSEINFDTIYPIGSFYFTSSNVNPSTLFGGTWEQIKDKFILSCGDKYANGNIGGTEQHQHKLPIGLNNVSDNWYQMHWNNAFGYGTDEFTSPNYNQLNSTPYGSSMTMHQLKSEVVSNMPPYLAVYVWKRVA